MPSPIAHSSVALLLWPMLKLDRATTIPSHKKWIMGGMLVFMTCGADVDFIAQLMGAEGHYLQHGGATHSFVFGVLAAALFTLAGRVLVPAPVIRLFCVGCLAWWSHVILDMFTHGGGVMALWPLTTERFVSPVPLFFGAKHSQPLAIHLHGVTLLTELPFVLLMWWSGRRLSRWFNNGRSRHDSAVDRQNEDAAESTCTSTSAA